MTRTMAELMPLRTIRIVWEDDEQGECEWCGKNTVNAWVIEADPIPERFCSTNCTVQDTGMCWEPQREKV